MTDSLDFLDEAVAALRAGLVVAIPTDTVYGLAAMPTVAGATQRIFAAKRRPRDVELPVLVATSAQLDGLVSLPLSAAAARLAACYWPGPLTLVVGRDPSFEGDLGLNPPTVGVRAPDHPLVRRLCAEVGPLAVTSANLHREHTPVDAAGVAAVFGSSVALVVDGGRCEGAPSTVVRVGEGGDVEVLREGRLPAADIFAVAAGA